jgi:pimeloyl-ACP methyl ester carboxylesterase
MSTITDTLTIAGIGPVEVTLDDRGEGVSTFLLLHGGGGTQTVASFADLLGASGRGRVITPTHPGFGGTPRPDTLNSIAGLATLYAALLEQRELRDVTVIGNSIGGWIAAELALVAPARLRSVILVDAAGIEVPGHPAADFFSLTMAQVAQLSYHDPDKFRIDPATLPPAAQAAMAGNRAALAVYGGTLTFDPTLRGRLANITTPTLVVWGDSDQMFDPDYGRAYAAAIPGARFQLLTATGHLPQLETPDQLLRAVWAFADSHTANHPAQ